jgi:hypothetical protein
MTVWPARFDWLSFRVSFHQAPLGLSGAHWLDDPPDLSCEDSTWPHVVDGPLLSCKQQVGGSSPPASSQNRSGDRDPTATAVARPQLPAPDHPAAGNGSGPPRDSRTRVRELVARERATGIRLAARDVAAAAGISERRAYELLRAVRAEGEQL